MAGIPCVLSGCSRPPPSSQFLASRPGPPHSSSPLPTPSEVLWPCPRTAPSVSNQTFSSHHHYPCSCPNRVRRKCSLSGTAGLTGREGQLSRPGLGVGGTLSQVPALLAPGQEKTDAWKRAGGPVGLQVGPGSPWLRGLLGFLRVCVFPVPQFPQVLIWHQASLKKASGSHSALRAVLVPR